MLMELFCDWFIGNFHNREQIYDDPKSAQYIMARHEREGENEIYCAYTYHRSKYPYRELLFNVQYENGEIHLTDKLTRAHLRFKHEGSTFKASVEHRSGDKLYIYKAVLGEGFYRVNDQCYNLEGDLIRGLPDDEWFRFKKVL